MKKKILLGWCPPAMLEMPSPSMSVLKAHLVDNGFQVEIRYWNIVLRDLQEEFLWNDNAEYYNRDFLSLLIFYNYQALEYNDRDAYFKVKSFLIGLKPQYLNLGDSFFDKHMKKYYQILDSRLNSIIDEIDFDSVLFIGLSANIFQWISTSVIAKKIKKRYSKIPIILGGIGIKEASISLLDNFPQFDIATWGEGESVLVKLSEYLINTNSVISENILEIPNIAVKIGSNIKHSNVVNHNFIDLSDVSVRPIYDDYFEQLLSKKIENIYIPIEGGRGCHWKKCNFCYLNTGYKYRVKPIANIKEEILSCIEKYNITSFSFLDNDVIANDLNRFDKLLNCLIDIKEIYPDFVIVMAEIITKGLNYQIVKKMSLAGFQAVQIGYETPSNNLLNKIHKKNTFSSNLLFIKFAIKYGITVDGANIIKGLIGETEEDIVEAIENLRYLRFFLSNKKFSHYFSNLGICSASRNFEAINSNDFKHNAIESILPEGLISEKELEGCFFTEKIHCNERISWFSFPIVEKYFMSSLSDYTLIDKGDSIIYKERLNKGIINEIELPLSSVEWKILKESNGKVISFAELKEIFIHLTDCELSNVIEELREEGLLYANNNYSEIVAIIDVDSVL